MQKKSVPKRLFYLSLLVNVLLALLIGFALHRLGGWRYAILRLQHQTAGLYHHRAQHFERLDEQNGSIIFLGDSQMAQAEWHEMFGDQPVVLNRGISGDFINGVQERLGEILRHRPLKIFLLIGVNDLIFGNEPAEIEAAYRQTVQKIRTESPDTELFLLPVLPVNNELRRSGTNNNAIDALNTRIRQIARDFALPFIDIATPLKDADGRLAAKFSEDGLHLNGLGYVVWKKEIEAMIKPE